MDFLRLPGALRRSILNHGPVQNFIRGLTTTTPHPPIAKSIPPQDPGLLRLSSETLNSYTTSYAPNSQQLKYANAFFVSSEPTFLYSAAYFRSFPQSSHPEVAFLGRSNVGKSSLLNALFGRTTQRAAHVSKKPGRTRTMNGFGIRGSLALGPAPKEGQNEEIWRRFPRGGLVVVDMPGYGAGSQEQWGKEALKYLEGRKQLRCTFVLVDAEHGLKASDLEILTHLRRKGIAHQIILSKVDKILYKGPKAPSPLALSNRLEKLRVIRAAVVQKLNETTGDGREHMLDILCCSAEKALDGKHKRLGVNEVRWSVMASCGMESDEMGEKKKWNQNLKILDDD